MPFSRKNIGNQAVSKYFEKIFNFFRKITKLKEYLPSIARKRERYFIFEVISDFLSHLPSQRHESLMENFQTELTLAMLAHADFVSNMARPNWKWQSHAQTPCVRRARRVRIAMEITHSVTDKYAENTSHSFVHSQR